MEKETGTTTDVSALVQFIAKYWTGNVLQVFTLMVLSTSWWRNDGKKTGETTDVSALVQFIGKYSTGNVLQVFTLMVLTTSWWRNDAKTNLRKYWRHSSCSVHWNTPNRKCNPDVHTDGTKYELKDDWCNHKVNYPLMSEILFGSLELN